MSFDGRRVLTALGDAKDALWSVNVIDSVMVLTVIAVAVAITWTLRGERVSPKPKGWKEKRDGVLASAGVFLVLVGAFVAYGSLRNQLRLTAEIAINQEGQDLLGYEMDDHNNIRCIYYNYGWNNPERCRAALTSSEEAWSRVLFYAEEALFVLTKANEDREHWGSRYAQDIGYWQEDVSRDPTGVFSYYLISTSRNLDVAADAMDGAGLCIPDMCNGYNIVEASLGGHAPKHLTAICKTEAEHQRVSRSCDISPALPDVGQTSPSVLTQAGK